MRFLSMIRTKETDRRPSERLLAEMGKLVEEMTANGSLVMTAGLLPSAEGMLVRSRYGKLSVVDGPFSETNEVIGGFAILEAPDKAAALALIKRFLEVHRDEWDLECEVRPMWEEPVGNA